MVNGEGFFDVECVGCQHVTDFSRAHLIQNIEGAFGLFEVIDKAPFGQFGLRRVQRVLV